MKASRLYKSLMWLTGIWTTFTVALAIWWLILVLRLLDLPMIQENVEFHRYRRMITQEGFALIFLLIGGGIALFMCLIYLRRQNETLRTFFATFTHELKTPLTNLRIQTEILRDKITDPSQRATVNRLATEGVRLELQLENSLFLADAGSSPLFLEPTDLNALISNLKQGWQNLMIEVHGSGKVIGDRRALEAIFRNLFQNSRTHGRAHRVDVSMTDQDQQTMILVSDDGTGFSGDASKLGSLFDRSNSRSGTGVGIWLIKNLSERMRGETKIHSDGGKLKFEIRLPRAP